MIALVPRDSLVGTIVGPILWSIYFVLSYLISGAACSLGYADRSIAGLNLVQLLQLLAGLVTALLITAAVIQAERGRRHNKKRLAREGDPDGAVSRRQFLYANAVILCGLSLVGTIWLAMAAAMTPDC